MSEQDMRTKVVGLLRNLDAIAVENPALPGTPDVNYVEGWIELKWLRAWPARETTSVRFKHFTKWQRIRQLLRRRAGGQSWVLIQCRREWILLDGVAAAKWLNYVTRQELYRICELFGHRSIDGITKGRLVEWISHQQKEFSLTDDDVRKLSTKPQSGTLSV